MDLDLSDIVTRYFFASRQTFDCSPLHISFTCDATRMGKRACMVGAIALPSNKFAWCPPQAALGIDEQALGSSECSSVLLRQGEMQPAPLSMCCWLYRSPLCSDSLGLSSDGSVCLSPLVTGRLVVSASGFPR